MKKSQNYFSDACKQWKNAELIYGNGRYALLAHCGVLTITLWDDLEEAKSAKKDIDDRACGGECRGHHEIIDMDKLNKRIVKK